MNLTNIIGKQVYSIYEGEVVGTVLQASFNNEFTKVCSFRIFDQEENEYELPMSGIKAIGDCLIISNKNKLNMFYEKAKKSPILKEVIDENANLLGAICDIEVDGFGNILNFLTTSNVKLDPSLIYVRKQFIFYCPSKIVISNLRPRAKKIDLENIKVNILNIDQVKNQTNFTPSKIQFNPDSILGKIAKNDLLGLNNEIIVKANQIITEKIIDDAGRHNRLNQLYYIAN